MEYSESPPLKRSRLDLQQNHGNNITTTRTTIHQLADEVIGISLQMLGGNGHFRHGPLACKMFLRASKLDKHFKKFTSGESVTSSVSCAMKYFEDEGTGRERLRFFWLNAARYWSCGSHEMVGSATRILSRLGYVGVRFLFW